MSYDHYAAQKPADVPLDQPLYGASFGQAISRYFKKYATFSGRASRSEYWWIALFSTVVFTVLFALMLIGGLATMDPSSDEPGAGIIPGTLLLILASLAMIVPSIAVTVRRLHDANYSGWFYLLHFTYVGSIVVLVFTLMESKPEGVRFDAGFNGQYPGQPGQYPMQPGQYPGQPNQFQGQGQQFQGQSQQFPNAFGTPGQYPGAQNPPAANPYGAPAQYPTPPNPYGTPGPDSEKPGA